MLGKALSILNTSLSLLEIEPWALSTLGKYYTFPKKQLHFLKTKTKSHNLETILPQTLTSKSFGFKMRIGLEALARGSLHTSLYCRLALPLGLSMQL